jgi:hypothetical protein
MREFTISAAAATVFAVLLASAPAQSENLNGQPNRVGNQCFKYTQGPAYPYAQGTSRDERFGTWTACPQTASASVAPAPRHVRRHQASSR